MSTANLTDMSILATDSVFGNRVFVSLIQYITSTVANEAITAATLSVHVARRAYAQQILNGPPENFKQRFVDAASANQTVANEATVNGTLVGLTQPQVVTQAALCLDADINNAVAAAFNAFISGI